MKRLHRLRQNPWLRHLTAETEFNNCQLIQPLFVVENLKTTEDILGLRGVQRQNPEETFKQVEKDVRAGVRQFLIFFVPEKKQKFNYQFAENTLRKLKAQFGSEINLWVDTCLCSWTDSGHCCHFTPNASADIKNTYTQIDLPKTLQALSEQAVCLAQAGADGVSPSDMMDGRTQFIRKSLDENGLTMTPIMSYSTKFASHFYGPFRNAADSTPQFGDRRQYQIDVRNRSDAISASLRCAEEGADLLMVKPGITSIDLISEINHATNKPVGAYQVSGEYAGMVLLAEKGLIQFECALLESWQVFKRARAQYIVTYGARLAKELGVLCY